MSAIKQKSFFRDIRKKQQGSAAVEFALVAIVFFTLFFGLVELARAMYVCNILQEVTRRAAASAANANFSDATVMQNVRNRAVFRESPGFLMFAQPVTDAHVKIDYMWIQRSGSGMTMVPIPASGLPASPAANYVNCLSNPYSQACIRLVRVRMCRSSSDDSCQPVDYQTLVSLVRLPFTLPIATTIVPAETLGLPAGVPPATTSPPCGCP